MYEPAETTANNSSEHEENEKWELVDNRSIRITVMDESVKLMHEKHHLAVFNPEATSV